MPAASTAILRRFAGLAFLLTSAALCAALGLGHLLPPPWIVTFEARDPYWLTFHIERLDTRHRVSLRTPPSALPNRRLSADGRFVISLAPNQIGEVRDLHTDEMRLFAGVHTLTLSNSGRLVYLTDVEHQLQVFDLVQHPLSAGPVHTTHLRVARATAPLVWTPDGESLLFSSAVSPYAAIHRIDLADLPADPLPVHAYPATRSIGQFNVRIAPDGRRAFYADLDSAGGMWLAELDLTTGVLRRVSPVFPNAAPFAWSADGQRFLYRSLDFAPDRVGLWSLADDSLTMIDLPHALAVESAVAWSPDERRVAFVTRTNGTNRLLVYDLVSRRVEQLIARNGFIVLR